MEQQPEVSDRHRLLRAVVQQIIGEAHHADTEVWTYLRQLEAVQGLPYGVSADELYGEYLHYWEAE